MENIQLTIAKQSKIYPISICKKKCHNWWLEWGFMMEINIKREEKNTGIDNMFCTKSIICTNSCNK